MEHEIIERKYGLPEALPLIRNGKLSPIYPLILEHRGNDFRLFGGKYIGEILNIYDLLYKLATWQVIDENNPFEYEAKIENGNLYFYVNSKWVLIGNITKPYFGAVDNIENKFNDQVENLEYISREFENIANNIQDNITKIKDSVEKSEQNAKNYAQNASVFAEQVNEIAERMGIVELVNASKALIRFRCVKGHLVFPVSNFVIDDVLYIEDMVYSGNFKSNKITINLQKVI